MFLACCVLPDKKLYGNRLYRCKYVRDFNGATQRLKATVPDRRVWLPTPACVIVAVRLSKALKDAHDALKGVKQSALRAVRFYKRLHLGKWNTRSKCMCQCAYSVGYTYDIIFVYCDCTMYSTVRYSYKCSL